MTYLGMDFDARWVDDEMSVAEPPPSSASSVSRVAVEACRADVCGSTLAVDLDARRTARLAPSVRVRLRRSAGWGIVEIVGEMDIQVHVLVDEVLHRWDSSVVFELHGVTFLDASGLGVMIGSKRRALETGGCVRLAAPSSPVLRLLALTGCDRTFEIFDSVGAAVSSQIVTSPGLGR